MSTEVPRSGATLSVATRVFAHQHGPSFHAEPLHNQIIVSQQALALLLHRRVGGACSPASAAWIWRKSHGRPNAARPIITPSTPNRSHTATTFAAQSKSPFPIRGMRRRWDLMRNLVPVRLAPKQLLRGAAVHGQRGGARGLDRSSHLIGGDLRRAAAEPDLRGDGDRVARPRHTLHDLANQARILEQIRTAVRPFATCRTGQPKLMSTTLTPYSRTRARPTSAKVRGSLSQIWTPNGLGSSATPQSRSGCSACFPIQEKPRALIISVNCSPTPP